MDKYDKEIERLTENPDKIQDSWQYPGPLFAYVVRLELVPAGTVGCLTMYRSKVHRPDTAPLEMQTTLTELANDTRLPDNDKKIEPKHLRVFAEWQRRLDREFPQYRNVV